MRNNRINIGDRLTIYPRKANYTQSPKRKIKNDKKDHQLSKNQKIYVVKPGDSLWSISKKFEGLSVEDLKKINNINNTTLKPGMTLKLKS
jgi:membrane-bound lytic murein transglycosylase D